MNIKNNQRYKMSSEKIETAFLALILKHRYEDITVSQICKKANINRSTFYCHYDDINDLYIVSDILITDYSSVFFDYAILQRPMLFYMYDMEEYRDVMRGFYYWPW